MTVELTVGKVAKIAGVPTDVLRGLCERGHVPARRGTAGSWYLDPADAPSAAQMRRILADEYRAALHDVQKAVRAIDVELEAVKLDCAEALDALERDPDASPPALGNDLRPAGRSETPMVEAVYELMHLSVWVSIRHRELTLLS